MSMTSKTLVPVEEYLEMSFDGQDSEYLDGEIVERPLPSIQHSKTQKRLLKFFGSLKQSISLTEYPEITLRLSPTRYRIADIAAFAGDFSEEVEYPNSPPEIA